MNVVVEVRRRASEAKGPFPGGKRVGSRGKKVKGRIKKAWSEHQRIYIRRSIRKGGLEGIDKRVGSWGKKKEKCWCKSKKKRVGSRGKKLKDPPIAVGESFVLINLWI